MNLKQDNHWKILIALILGALIGTLVNIGIEGNNNWKEIVSSIIDTTAHPIGQIFLRILFIVVVPLVFASLASGVAGLGVLSKLGRLGGRTFLMFFATSAFSATIGIIFLGIVRPGDGFDPAARDILMKSYASQAVEIQSKVGTVVPTGALAIVNQLLDMFIPRNIVKAIVNMEMIPLIVFSLLLGASLTKITEEKRLAFIKWLDAITDAMITIVGFAMKLAPLAVFCLIFSVTARFGLELLQKLGIYVSIVLVSYSIVIFVFYPIILKILTNRKPFVFLRDAMPIMVTAFSLSSSNGTLPTTIRVSETTLGIRHKIASFVLPLGATMNMNGTALFEGAAVLFIAQVFGIELSISQQILVVALCVISAIGVAGVPGASLPLLMIVMAQVGVPPEGLAIILGVDRILDMGRTVVNVTGDVVCAAYVNEVEKDV